MTISEIANELSRCVNKKCDVCEFNNQERCQDLLINHMGNVIRDYVRDNPDDDDMK